jgi:carbon storage regulator
MVGDTVTVTVLAMKGGHVRLGIKAPREVAVHREELYERIKSQQQQGIAPAQPEEKATATAVA